MSRFNLNMFAVSGILGDDPKKAPHISPSAVHFRLMVRSPFEPDDPEYQEKYFYPLDLYAYGQQGDLLLNHFKKGSHVTVFGSVMSERISVRGRAEGVAKLKVEGLDLKYYIRNVPTTEELGFAVSRFKKPVASDEEGEYTVPDEDEKDVIPVKKKQPKNKSGFIY